MSGFGLLCFIFIIIFFGAALQEGFGFGLGPLCVAFLPMLMPFSEAIILFLLIALVGNIIISCQYFKYINWKVLIPLLIPTSIILAVVALLTVNIEASYIYIILGAILIALAIFFFVFSGKIHIKASPLSGFLVGIVCGICGGFCGLAGPGAALYFVPALENKKSYLGTFQMYFLLINVLNILIRFIKGISVKVDITILIVAIVALIVGTVIGHFALKKVEGKWFERGVYVLIGLNGLWVVISNVFSI